MTDTLPRATTESGRPPLPPEATGTPSDEGELNGPKKRWYERLQLSIAVAAVVFVVMFFVSVIYTSSGNSEFGAMLGMAGASFIAGALIGFLVGGPGLKEGDDATSRANEAGWSSRLAVFSNWVSGAAFVLVLTNFAKITDWFSGVTDDLSGGTTHSDTLYRYTLGAWMIAGAALGFMFGFYKMVTFGRSAISRVEREVKEVRTEVAQVRGAVEQIATNQAILVESIQPTTSFGSGTEVRGDTHRGE